MPTNTPDTIPGMVASAEGGFGASFLGSQQDKMLHKSKLLKMSFSSLLFGQVGGQLGAKFGPNVVPESHMRGPSRAKFAPNMAQEGVG